MKFTAPIDPKYKVIHLFTGNTVFFQEKLLKLYKTQGEELMASQTLFVFVKKDAYEKMSQYENTVYIEGAKNFNAAIVNFCAKYCDWLFIHNLCCSPIEVLKINKKARGKIIWRSWGSDVGYNFGSGNLFTRRIKKVISRFQGKVIRQFYGVGIGNVVDKIDIEERFGDVKTFSLSYISDSSGYDFLQELKGKMPEKKETVNILIGHSGYSNDNHIPILESLLKYRKEKIKIFLILVYGEEAYIKQVKEYAKKTWQEKVVIVEKFLPYEEYAKMLSDMDIAFFDGTRSYALGNISALITLHKKIFLNRNGVIKKAFDRENVPCCCTDEIKEMTFEQFVEKLQYPQNANELEVKSFACRLNNWKNLLDELRRKKNYE